MPNPSDTTRPKLAIFVTGGVISAIKTNTAGADIMDVVVVDFDVDGMANGITQVMDGDAICSQWVPSIDDARVIDAFTAAGESQ